MLSSAICQASDPEQYVRAIRPAGVELTVTQRGQFSARNIRIDLHRLYLQRGRESLSRVAHMESARIVVKFLAQPGPSMIWNGEEVGYDSIALHGPGRPQFHRLSGRTEWAGLSFLPEDLAEIAALPGNVSARGNSLIILPPVAAISRLRLLHAEAAHLAETAPQIIAHPETARGLEQAVIQAMLGCVSAPDLHANSAVRRNHALIVKRFCELLEANPDRPMYMPEIMKAVGGSGRAMRNACQEYLGISPSQYLLLRRMNLARRALRQADRSIGTVTNIATEYGFWELGRFAVRYRALFGESPSATLRAPAS
jgi:AraC-like DNA-binding protein